MELHLPVETHPGTAHFPIGMLTMAGIFAIISLFRQKEFFKEAVCWTLLIGIIAAVFAILTGLYEKSNLIHNDAIHEILTTHEITGYITAGLFVILFAWFAPRRKNMGDKEYKTWIIFIWVACAMLLYQGYTGGEMVYKEGAAVEPMEKHIEQSEHDHSHNEH